MSPEAKASTMGAAILALGALGRLATGTIYSSAKALDLIEAVRSSALYLGSAMATSAATTLALMLTVVGLVSRVDHDFEPVVYRRIKTIAWLSTLSLIGSVVMLLVLTLPVGEFKEMPARWFPWLYNAIYALVIGLSALLVATVVMLFASLIALIGTIAPSRDRDQ